jgi:hypothetical protein
VGEMKKLVGEGVEPKLPNVPADKLTELYYAIQTL